MPRHGVMTFRRVSFSYDGGEALFTELDLDLHRGFTGCVGANGAGKTTLLRLAVGDLEPLRGHVRGGGVAVYCPQRTDEPPPGLAEFLDATDAESCALRGRLQVEESWGERWTTLSHGERKRCQIGTALWRAPDLLAIDEPTNHIDAAARALLVDALRRFRGVGLLVSHDRDLLDALCSHCLWIDPPQVEVHRGGYSQTTARRREEAERDRAALERAQNERDRLEREVVKRKEAAARSHKERSKRGIPMKDHDARGKKNRARISGKDGQAGRLYKQLLGRTAQVEGRLQAITRHKEYEQGISFSSVRSRRDLVIDAPAHSLPLGDRILRFESLRVPPTGRVAITGANGSGKSTLVRHLYETLRLAPADVLYLPQEVAAEDAAALLDEAKRLSREQLGQMMTLIRRLGSHPGRLLESACPSPGELRKLLLAMGIVRTPQLLLLDEPTNHLDLPSIESLESALAECPCALLLVSHDERFLERLTTERWHVAVGPDGHSRLLVESPSA